ncbi:hypothetical protein PanWU01x14_210870 [Parasponia andersonii]|uniref:Uncharacterized protein n=1 Tax=Parasponia andersonii TaxID=3476 RepID=A0A2P5BTZ2_PARAD|nr:hypothetical protein PanWU01x14_210870 [Parasponia andersonii]
MVQQSCWNLTYSRAPRCHHHHRHRSLTRNRSSPTRCHHCSAPHGSIISLAGKGKLIKKICKGSRARIRLLDGTPWALLLSSLHDSLLKGRELQDTLTSIVISNSICNSKLAIGIITLLLMKIPKITNIRRSGFFQISVRFLLEKYHFLKIF